MAPAPNPVPYRGDVAADAFTRRLLIVEDDPLTGALLADVLRGHGFEVQVVNTAVQARGAARTFDPDAALLDIQLGDGPSGVALAHVLHATFPHIALLFLTRFPDQRAAGLVEADIPAGCGFLRKDRIADAEYLLTALNAVMTDHPADHRDDLASDRPLAALTRTQMAVLRMVAQGRTNASIARERGTSESAVEHAIAGITRALGIAAGTDVNPRVEAARLYIAAAGLPER